MSRKRIHMVSNRFLNFAIALVFVLAAVVFVLFVNYRMRQQALDEAEAKARIILERNLATHTYFTNNLWC